MGGEVRRRVGRSLLEIHSQGGVFEIEIPYRVHD